MKLAIFDLDGTLAELGEWIKPENVDALKRIESKGVRIAICSGKPVYYLCGFLRQVGLEAPVLAGENGAVVQLDVDLPPKKFYVHEYPEEARLAIKHLENEIEKAIPGLWYQPNLVGLTPFPRSFEEFEIIQAIINENAERYSVLDIYRHVDTYDVTPKGVNKKLAVKFLGEILNIDPKDMVSVGDGVNDYPMFEATGYSIGVHVKEPWRVNINCPTVDDALKHLEEIIE